MTENVYTLNLLQFDKNVTEA